MANEETVRELKRLLQPFVKEHPLKKDTVYQEDAEDLIGFAIAFKVEEKLLKEVKANPNGKFRDFLYVIPEGVPKGQEDILYDMDDDE